MAMKFVTALLTGGLPLLHPKLVCLPSDLCLPDGVAMVHKHTSLCQHPQADVPVLLMQLCGRGLLSLNAAYNAAATGVVGATKQQPSRSYTLTRTCSVVCRTARGRGGGGKSSSTSHLGHKSCQEVLCQQAYHQQTCWCLGPGVTSC